MWRYRKAKERTAVKVEMDWRGVREVDGSQDGGAGRRGGGGVKES